MLESKNEDQRKCDVGSKVMYEGKHIHYSEVDNKPLCSYSTKLCKQRRLNGYAFCIRHVLEDKTAPFKQCEYVAKYNNQRCTNPIPKNENRIYCNSHLQVLGIVPKKERKKKSGDVQDKKVKDVKEKEKKKEKVDLTVDNHNEIESEPDVYTFIPSPPSEEKKPPPKSPRSSGIQKEKLLKAKIQDKITKNKLKLEKEREKELKAKVNHLNKLNMAPLTSQSAVTTNVPTVPPSSNYTHVPMPSFPQPPIFPTIPPYPFHVPHLPMTFPDITLPWLPTSMPQRLPILQVRPKRPRQLKSPHRTNKCLEKLLQLYRSKEENSLDLFPLGLDYSDEEDDNSDDAMPWQQTRIDNYDSDSSSVEDLEISTIRYQKVDSLESKLRQEYSQLRHCRHSHNKSRHLFHKNCARTLIEAVRASPRETVDAVLAVRNQSLKTRLKRSRPLTRCKYKGENKESCHDRALPFTRYCVKHIICSEDQVLFAYCTAKFPGGVQCSVPVFDIVNERPLCEEHARKMANVQKGEANRKALLADGKAPPRKPRKKTKPSALTRPSKKKKKKKQQRRNGRPQKPVPPAKPSGNTEMPQTLNLGIDTSQLSPAPEGIDTEDITDHLDSDLPPDVIEKNLELTLDPTDLHMDGDGLHMDSDALNSDQQSDYEPDKQLLEGHDFDDWARLPDDLNDLELFTGCKNGVFAPTKEDEEALERALKEASEDVKASLAQLNHLSPDTQTLPNLILPSGHENHNANHIIADGMPHHMDIGSSMAYTVTPQAGTGQGSFQEGRGSVQNSSVQSQPGMKNDMDMSGNMMNHWIRDMNPNQDPLTSNNRRFSSDVSTMSPHSAPISPHGNHFQADVPRTVPHDTNAMLNHQMLNSANENLMLANQRPWNSYTALHPNTDQVNLLSLNHQNGPSVPISGPPSYSPNPNFIQGNKFNLTLGQDQLLYSQVSHQTNHDQPQQSQGTPLISAYNVQTATPHQQSTS
ncbi:INO80 complex subunit D-like isoform X1 [Glandiceps talaboti]